MMKFRLPRLAATLCLLLAGAAHAAPITYTATPLGGSEWRYDYTLAVEPELPAFDEFTVYFDSSTYVALALVAAPSPWDALVIQPDLGIPADGFFDAVKLAGFAAPGSTYSGFSVRFKYTGADAPGSQRFDLIDSSGFMVVGDGRTAGTAVAVVPEPSSIALVVAALGAGFIRPRRQA